MRDPRTSPWHNSTVTIGERMDFTQHELSTIEVTGNSVEDVEYLSGLWSKVRYCEVWESGYAEGRFDEYVEQNAITPYVIDLAKEKSKGVRP